MKAFLVSNFGQRAQALASSCWKFVVTASAVSSAAEAATTGVFQQKLVALLLTMAALILLLGMSSWLPSVEARGPAAVGLDNADFVLSSSDTITTFLPIVFKSDVAFFDDFSNTSSGWPHKATLSQNCYVEYSNGIYRVKVTKKDQRCLIPNSNSSFALFTIPT